MYAVIQTGGRQHRVEIGEVVRVDRLEAEAGATVSFDRVLAIGDGDALKVGSPTVSGATVSGTVVEQGRGKKVLIYRYRPRKNASRRRGGHRQDYTAVKIDAIKG
ncbi:MAG TPA: 50S ribosomal protein L21 [Candidatus Sulfotelmatobacter sp.]|jgi:large subunit ribosomal protein L21|nr:50S ribosomal protein L21 [Candidatus Sulfotelmatobacter sp.]